MNRKPTQLSAVSSLILPILLGLAAFVLLYGAISQGLLTDAVVNRYLAGHAVSKVTTALFLIGFASLALIARDVLNQHWSAKRITLGAPETASEATASQQAAAFGDFGIQRLVRLPRKTHQHYLWRRLHVALSYLRRTGSPDGLDEELKYAAETDADEKEERYAFVRIMIWAIPMLGFLGTVLGISEALGSIQIGENNDFQGMMGGLRSSLYIAFDTTAVALTFSIVLMFIQFAVDRCETSLLSLADTVAREELSGHQQTHQPSKDPHVKVMEAIGKSLLVSTEKLTEKLVVQQVELWRKSIRAAEKAWIAGVDDAQRVVQAELTETVGNATSLLGERLEAAIHRSDEAVAQRLEQWQLSLSENARLLLTHQQELVTNSQNINLALQRLNEMADMKETLVNYVQALPDASDFAAVSKQLSTAIRLLEFRLNAMDDRESGIKASEPAASGTHPDGPGDRIKISKNTGRAA